MKDSPLDDRLVQKGENIRPPRREAVVILGLLAVAGCIYEARLIVSFFQPNPFEVGSESFEVVWHAAFLSSLLMMAVGLLMRWRIGLIGMVAVLSAAAAAGVAFNVLALYLTFTNGGADPMGGFVILIALVCSLAGSLAAYILFIWWRRRFGVAFGSGQADWIVGLGLGMSLVLSLVYRAM